MLLLLLLAARLAAGVNITVRVAGVEQPGDCSHFLGRLEVGIISRYESVLHVEDCAGDMSPALQCVDVETLFGTQLDPSQSTCHRTRAVLSQHSGLKSVIDNI